MPEKFALELDELEEPPASLGPKLAASPEPPPPDPTLLALVDVGPVDVGLVAVAPPVAFPPAEVALDGPSLPVEDDACVPHADATARPARASVAA